MARASLSLLSRLRSAPTVPLTPTHAALAAHVVLASVWLTAGASTSSTFSTFSTFSTATSTASTAPTCAASPTASEADDGGDDGGSDSGDNDDNCRCAGARLGARDPADFAPTSRPMFAQMSTPPALPDGPLVDGADDAGGPPARSDRPSDDVLDLPLVHTTRPPRADRPVPQAPRAAYPPDDPCVGSGCDNVNADLIARVGIDSGVGYAVGDLAGAEMPLHVSASVGLPEGVRIAAHAIAAASAAGARGGVFVGPQLSFDVADVVRVEGGAAVGLAHSGGNAGAIAPAWLAPFSVAAHVTDRVDVVFGGLVGQYAARAVESTGDSGAPDFGANDDSCAPAVPSTPHALNATPSLWGALTLGLATEFDLP